jgi:hypothetical protein
MEVLVLADNELRRRAISDKHIPGPLDILVDLLDQGFHIREFLFRTQKLDEIQLDPLTV